MAFLPVTAVIVVTATVVQTRLLERLGARVRIASGMALGVVAMLLFTRLTPESGYVGHVLPGLLIIGLGMGCIVAPAFGTATVGVDGNEAGVASAMTNTAQQGRRLGRHRAAQHDLRRRRDDLPNCLARLCFVPGAG